MATGTQVPVYADQVDPGISELCVSGWSCQQAALASKLWLYVMVLLSVGFVIASVGILRRALSELDEEQSRTAAERDAFAAFADRVTELSPDAGPGAAAPTSGDTVAMVTAHGVPTGFEAVRSAYRETVMSVSHYKEEYAEPLAEHMAIEFGDDVAESVRNGVDLSPILKQLLVMKARQAAKQREDFINRVKRERSSVREHKETFNRIQSELACYHPHELQKAPFPVIADRWEALDSLESKCKTEIDTRQQDLQQDSLEIDAWNEDLSLIEYFYSPLEVDYPVLAVGTDILDQIQTSRRTIVRIASSVP